MAIRTITICDVPAELRAWLRDVDTVHARAPDVMVKVATRSCKQALLEPRERCVLAQAALVPPMGCGAILWPPLR